LLAVTAPGVRHLVTVNAEIFVLAHENAAYEAILMRTVNVIDGRPIQWFAALLNRNSPPQKLSGSDFIYDMAAYCQRFDTRLFLLGASRDSNDTACRRLSTRYPGLQISGYSPPMRSSTTDREWTSDIMQSIRAYRPEYLAVCFGSPMQEIWIDLNRAALESAGVRFVAGLGGSIDFVSGQARRAPKIVQSAGLEWLFRLFAHPRKRFKRTLRMLRFPYYAVSQSLRRSRGEAT
jgi:N-acetylglucosaminyldiphosphoundecaprenol N-acetyl-beta-D-mannosaminyltransferase